MLYPDPNIREVFALRKTTVEPFQGQLKERFGLERLPLKALANVHSLCLFAALAYTLPMALNFRQGRPPAQIKDIMLALP